MEQRESPGPRVGRFALFVTFSRISLSSFDGALFWAQRGLVERQRWLTEREFVDLLSLGQLLPGPNVLNLTVMVGYRFADRSGAAAAVAGFLGWPCLAVIGIGVLYQHYGALPPVQQVLAGMSKVALALPRGRRPWLFGMLAFVGASVMLLGVNAGMYLNQIQIGVDTKDVMGGFLKAVIFSVMVSTICSFQDYFTHMRAEAHGAKSVSLSTTAAVVLSCVVVLVGTM